MTRALRLILRHARSGNYTARQLRDRFAPIVTVRRIQQLLAEDPHLTWRRAAPAPELAPTHKAARVEWARKIIVKGERWWQKIVFSNESRFILDDPDVLSVY